MQDWMTQARKGLVELWLLGHIGQGQTYGYQLAGLLFERGGQAVGAGTIYPVLARFRREGWVAAHTGGPSLGRRRRYYRLTPAGVQRLNQMIACWRQMVRATERAVGAQLQGPGGPRRARTQGARDKI